MPFYNLMAFAGLDKYIWRHYEGKELASAVSSLQESAQVSQISSSHSTRCLTNPTNPRDPLLETSKLPSIPSARVRHSPSLTFLPEAACGDRGRYPEVSKQ